MSAAMNTVPRFLVVLPVILIVAAAAEGIYLQNIRRQSYDWRAYFASLGDAIGRLFINRIIGFGMAGAVFGAVARFRINTIPMDRWWSWLGLLLALEFFYYWMHRADHRVQWLWATHAVHHSTNAYNLSAAYRLGWTSGISGGFLFFAPLVWIGFPVQAVLIAAALNLLYQFWLHTELVPQLGPLEWILNTPAHHRIHHARNPEYIDKNFGGVLIIFDRLFGTFASQHSDVPCDYGLVHRVTSYNPLRIATHTWASLWRQLRRAAGVRQVAKVLLGPPV
jgi:sterol desaturase/sphingolipid hydroxylase (fatty acid hydroxylase superfamily)